MNSKHEEHNQGASKPGEGEERGPLGADEFVVPGAPIVRSSTPRPLSFASETNQLQVLQQPEHDSMSAFPPEAPSAPPLPEEFGENEQGGEKALDGVEATPLPGRQEPAEEAPAEFLWLFEYGLEMDASFLNSAERLHGLALLYGPAVLKGYEITFDVISSRAGPVVASILPGRKREAEVWGILYRIPRRLIERSDNEPALLDKIHSAVPPDGLFERLSVSVHETYRGREITCITYIASANALNQFHLLPRNCQIIDASYVQRFLDIAGKQKLPGDYLQELALLAVVDKIIQPVAPGTEIEQNTEPLPILVDKKRNLLAPVVRQRTAPKTYSIGMVIFAFYLVLALLAVFTFALLQGLGVVANLFPASFSPLGIPWFVLVYGFIGGCLSCIVSLGRHPATQLPAFVVISWFARPFIGVVLAIVMFLLLDSGLFALNGNLQEHSTIYSLVAVLAGSCEGWLFYKSK